MAETVSAFEASKDSGSDPYFSTPARSRASSWENCPEIWVFPPKIASLIRGADTTSPSSTNAADSPTWVLVYSPQIPDPSGLNVRFTT